jgi:RNA polymerase-interacting CarD/CdnL/TRCF family regulator
MLLETANSYLAREVAAVQGIAPDAARNRILSFIEERA